MCGTSSDRHGEQWSKGPEAGSHIDPQLFFDNDAKKVLRSKIFQRTGAEEIGYSKAKQ